MVSNFQFLAKALRFPATAPTLLALSLTAFVASQLHDRLSSQAFPGLADDQDSDNSPEEDTREPAAPPSSQAVPEQLPLEISPLEGIPDLTLSPRQVMERIQGSALVADGAKILPNLEVTLPQPVAPVTSLKTTTPQTRGLGVSRVRVSPQVVEAVVTQSLAYKTVAGSTGISRESSQGSTDWIDLEGHWSKPYVEALAGLGLIEGLPDGHFEPDRPMTRAELADLLQRSLPRPQLRPGLTPLNDVPAQHWAAQSIEQAVGMGFFPDVESTGAFNPDRPASRLVTWGAIVSGLNLPSSKQHNELLQAWEASRAHPLANTPNSATPNSNTLQAELSQPVTRGEVAALLYHALRLTDEGQKLAEIVPAQTPSTSTATASTLAQETHSASSIVPPSIPTSTIETSTLPVSTIATSTIAPSSTIPTSTPRTTETIPLQSSGAIEPLAPPIETLSPPPLLVAAQLPLPDPLLSPLPPVSAETSGSIGSDDLGLAPASPREAQVERVSPEFSAEPLSLDPLNSPDLASSAEVTPTQNSVNTTFADPLPLDETYTLGAGDRVFIEVFGLPQYSQEYQILVDGSLNLPRAGRMVVEGMTLAQAESLIYARYARYYQQPATSVVLVAPRSLRISVTGEVNRPGVYRLSPSEGSAVLNLTQALQEAGGIRQDADLRQIKVYRSQRDGTPQELSLNLWSLLQTGDLTQDISLRDGDRVIIPKAESFNIEDVNQMATANIAPSTINITVVGSDAANQGSLQVSPNTPLNQVVLAAGGFNDRRESRTAG